MKFQIFVKGEQYLPHALECGVLEQIKVENKLFLFEGGSGKFQIFVKALC